MSDSAKFNSLAQNLVEDGLSVALATDPSESYLITAVQPSPCAQACPAGVKVKSYVGLIAAGRFEEALEVVRQDNPFPAICGRVCHHPCEATCRRGEFDEPVAICWLKRFVADYEMARPQKEVQPLPRTRPQRVAVVGAGPAGLTAASDLIRRGYGVTVFEAHSEPGGMFVIGIPEYRLPRDVIQTEIQHILDLGVELRTGVMVGRDLTLDDLLEKEGFQAVFIGVGAHLSRQMGIPGEKGPGVEDCLVFLRHVNTGKPSKPGRRVVVIGGGHSAMDCARTAVRLGSEEVRVLYRRTEEEMPAEKREVEEAEHEGVQFTYLVSPVRVLRKEGKVVGLECIRNTLGEPDSSGRRRPVPVEGSEFVVDTDLILSAVGQKPDLVVAQGKSDLAKTRWDTLAVDEATLGTSVPGVFAGGDAATGPQTVIDAIAQGHKAARSIARYLESSPSQAAVEPITAARPPLEAEIKVEEFERENRPQMPQLAMSQRLGTFEEVNLGFTQATAIQEAQRCLRCGPCAECSLCVTACSKRHLFLSLPSEPAISDGLVIRVPKEHRKFSILDDSVPALLSRDRGEKGGPASRTALATFLQTLTCSVDPERCRGCGTCVETCEYGAPTLTTLAEDLQVARINPELCKACGVCAAQCPCSAISIPYLADSWIEQRLDTIPLKSTIVVFSCSWNRAAAEGFLDLHSRDSSTPLRHIPVTCSGRVQPSLVLKAFERGAAAVALVRCAQDECHYGFGSRYADLNIEKTLALLRLLGIGTEKLRQWCVGSQDLSDFHGSLALFERDVRKSGIPYAGQH